MFSLLIREHTALLRIGRDRKAVPGGEVSTYKVWPESGVCVCLGVGLEKKGLQNSK